MTKYKQKTTTNKMTGKRYTYYFWQYKDNLGKWKYEQASTIETLNAKVIKRTQLLSAGINSLNTHLENYVENYLRTVHFNRVKEKTKERYLSILNCHLKGTALGRTKMRDLTLTLIQAVYNTLTAIDAKNLQKIINPALRYAGVNRDINFVITPKILTLPQETTQEQQKKASRNAVRPLTEEEHLSFIEDIIVHPMEPLYRTAIDTGMRQGELFAITWADIDFERMRITINKTGGYTKGDGDHYRWLIGLPKNKIPRINKLPKVLIPLLKNHKAIQRKELAKLDIIQNPETLVFCTPLGTHLDPSNTLAELKKVFASLGISKEKVFHDLRHTYATRQFEAGMEPLVVSKLLGHSDVNTTLRTYIHVLQNIQDATADTTDAFYAQMQDKSDASFTSNLCQNIFK